MDEILQVTGIAQVGLAIIFIWLWWQERQETKARHIEISRIYEARVAEQKQHNDSLMALLVMSDNALTEPQRVLRRQFQSFADWSKRNPPDPPIP